MNNVLLRVDASPEMGIGHFMRCLALGQRLQEQGQVPIFVSKKMLPFLPGVLKKEKIETIPMPADTSVGQDADFVIRAAKRTAASWVVLDGYDLIHREYQRAVVKNGLNLLCIDDLAQDHFLCQAVVNQNLGAESLRYSRESYTKLFLGTKYLLVRKEYRELRSWQRPIREKAKNILVTLGGGPSAFMREIGKAICSLRDPSLRIKMIVGTDVDHQTSLRETLKPCSSRIETIPFRYDMLTLMKWADVVITAAGSTVWELLLTHAPMMIFTIADNQRIVEEFMGRYQCAKIGGWIEDVKADQIAGQLRDLLASKEVRLHYMSQCQALIQNEVDFFDPKMIF